MPRPAMRTFLFTDLRDYTLFIETRGDQAATKMLRASRRIVRAAVARHRGAEIKTEGDSFYVVFRSPSAAVRCAIEIQRANVAHTAKCPDVPVRMGYGINTGEAVPHDKGYVGSAVIVANRLSTSAKPEQILITDTVRSLVRTGAHASMRELGAWTLKGVAQPIRVFEVDATPATAQRALGPALRLPALLSTPALATPGLVVCPELVQREAPLAALIEHLEAAARGETRIVAVSGEGGIGKTRLVRELAERAHRDGMYVFGGRSHASGPPYEPIVAALRPYAHARGTEILRRLLGPLVVELRRLLPEIDVSGGHADVEVPSDERRERFLRTIALLLEDAAAQRPVLLALEDFHDADDAMRDLLRYLASGLHAGICVALTYRDEEVGAAHPLRATLAELDRDRRLARVPLAPLDLEGVERMTATLLPGRDTTALARVVFERSEGIPFYVEELLKTALDDGDDHPDALALPRTIADSVRLRVTRLVGARGPGVADLLEAAAVAEVPLGYDALIQLSDRDEAEADADLAAAIEAQLLERPARRSELYQYRHALTREAVAAAISPARRRRLHARVARTIEAQGDPTARAALLARHFAAAGDRPKALAYARQGAANAIRVGAYASAIDHLRNAVSMSSGTTDEPDVLEELAAALQAAGRAAEAEQAVNRAREVARERADASRLARLDVFLARILRMEGRRAEALAAVGRAVAILGDRPGASLARALVTQAELHWAENDAEPAGRIAAQALAIARDSRANAATVAALTIHGAALSRLGDATGIDSLREAIRLGTENDLHAETVEAHLELSRALNLRGETDAARRAAESGLALARDRGLEFAQARILAQLVRLRLNEGRPREAQALAEQALALARPGTIAAGAAKIALADVLTNQGDAAGALAILEQVAPEIELSDPERRMIFHVNRAAAVLTLGHVEAAKASIEEAIHMTLERTGQGVSAFVTAVDVAEALRDGTWLRWLAATFESYFDGRDSGGIRAVRAELAGIRALTEGGDPAADFERAAGEYEALGVRHRGAYRRATGLLADLADPARAYEVQNELATLRDHLADRGSMRYALLIDRALARPRSEIRLRQELLDDRELRVALLVARGLTDVAIGAEIGVAPRAASALVREVLRKLGVESRSQVASWIVRRGLSEVAPVS